MEFHDVTDESVFLTKHELRRTPKGRQKLAEMGVSMKGYERGQRTKYQARTPFSQRRFVAWDGESIRENIRLHPVEPEGVSTDPGYFERSDSVYVLFGNSDGRLIYDRNLSTAQCLNLICDAADPEAIHFGFAFGYDVNMILRDLSQNHLRILHKKGSVRWDKYRIEYLPRKWFVVTDRVMNKTVKIWDVWTFFMTSAVQAWKVYGVEVSETVLRGKEERGDIPYEKLWTDIYPYWKEENLAYVQLMEKLREALHSADLYISAWHGPGAIASHSLQKHGMRRAMATCPEDVNLAAQYAYGGGRFDMHKVGRANAKVFEYDVNSAYPYAISQLPDLSRGQWTHVLSPSRIARFGVYRVRLRVNPFDPISNFHRPMPFFHRDPRGQISFPCVVDTWVWSPELWGMSSFPGLEVCEGWEFEEEGGDSPFAWLAENYKIRQQYKAEGNAAQLALKLQMNSMYGKMAQRVGWNEEKKTAPKWHQLEWAGWVTSYCRAMVYRAGLLAGTDLVAFETDAVFSLCSLADKLDIGDGLGQWEETIFDDFIYLQSGCRFGLRSGEWESKYRGFDRGSLSLDETMDVLSREPEHWTIMGTTRRFVGFAQALHTDFSQWREFQSGKPRTLHIGGEGKRRHIPRLCRSCREGIPASITFHDCALSNPVGGQSTKHYLPWRDAELLETQLLANAEKHEIILS